MRRSLTAEGFSEMTAGVLQRESKALRRCSESPPSPADLRTRRPTRLAGVCSDHHRVDSVSQFIEFEFRNSNFEIAGYCGSYSYRNALIGSMRIARRAGR